MIKPNIEHFQKRMLRVPNNVRMLQYKMSGYEFNLKKFEQGVYDQLFFYIPNETDAIHDFENFYGYKVGEYSSIQELNEYAEKLEEISDRDHLKDFLEIYSIDDIINNKDDLDFVEAENDEDLAQELIEQMGGLEVLSIETLQRYFNFGAYGLDLAIGDYSKTSHGYIRDI